MQACEPKKCKEKLITNLNELCDTCWIRSKVNEVRENMIQKYEFIEQNNTPDFLKKFLDQKILHANKKIEELFNHEANATDLGRDNRTSFLLSWQDTLRYYSQKLQTLNMSPSKNQEPMLSQPKRRVHIDAIKNEIDWLFSERVKQSEALPNDAFMDGIQCIEGINYVFRKINRRDKIELNQLAKRELAKYLAAHPDNTIELFQAVYIEKAQYLQTYFPKYKTDNKEKEIFFALQRWIETLENLNPKKIPKTEFAPALKFYKEADFDSLANDLIEIDEILVDNLLEHHYALASKPKSMGASNWLLMLHKQLLRRFPKSKDNLLSKEELSNLSYADLWIKNKLSDQVQRTFERTNKIKPDSDTIERNKLPDNPFPKIFTSYRGFQIFEAFKEEVVTDATEYADYSFLFTSLKKDELIHDLKHKIFIDFLGSTYNAKFAGSYKQFKYSETLEKKKAYSRIKKLFQ